MNKEASSLNQLKASQGGTHSHEGALAVEPELNAQAEWVRSISSSKFNYWAGYAANITIVLWLLSQAFVGAQSFATLSALEWFVCSASGLIVWTFLEYALHRFTYHEIPSPLRIGHELHHEKPKALMGVPWYLTTVIIIGVYYGLAYFFNPARTGVVMGIAWLGYIGYCLIHHAIHHWKFENTLFKKIRKHHLIHHVHPEHNHGISTDLWDRVFGTKR